MLAFLSTHFPAAVQNDPHRGNVGCWIPAPDACPLVELFDMERASWYGCAGEHPPIEFLRAYAQAVEAVDRCEQKVRLEAFQLSGMDATRIFFKDRVRDADMFRTAFDWRLFVKSPRGRWASGAQ